MVSPMMYSRKELEPYMPHSGAMLLIDRIVDYGPEHIVAEVDVGPHLPFYTNGAVPAYLGIELMAQSIAAWSGIRRANPASRPPIGFLLGTRRFESALASFQAGTMLKTCARKVLENDDLAMFECAMDLIDIDGVQVDVAAANISVYSVPENSNQNFANGK